MSFVVLFTAGVEPGVSMKCYRMHIECIDCKVVDYCGYSQTQTTENSFENVDAVFKFILAVNLFCNFFKFKSFKQLLSLIKLELGWPSTLIFRDSPVFLNVEDVCVL